MSAERKERKFASKNYTEITHQFGNRFLYSLDEKRGYRSWEPSQHKSIAAYTEYWSALRAKIGHELWLRFQLKPRALVSTAAVLHLRCGDVPFKRNPAYRLPPHSFYSFAAEQILIQGATRILIHRPPERRKRHRQFFACAHYINQTANCLQNATGLPTEIIQTQKERQALSDFIGARLLIVPVPSTFSFAPGLCLGRPRYLTAAFPVSKQEQLQELSQRVPWALMHNQLPFDHDDVVDYYQDFMKGRFLPAFCPRLNVPNDTNSLATKLCPDCQQGEHTYFSLSSSSIFSKTRRTLHLQLVSQDLSRILSTPNAADLDMSLVLTVSTSGASVILDHKNELLEDSEGLSLQFAAASCCRQMNSTQPSLGFTLHQESHRRLQKYFHEKDGTNLTGISLVYLRVSSPLHLASSAVLLPSRLENLNFRLDEFQTKTGEAASALLKRISVVS